MAITLSGRLFLKKGKFVMEQSLKELDYSVHSYSEGPKDFA